MRQWRIKALSNIIEYMSASVPAPLAQAGSSSLQLNAPLYTRSAAVEDSEKMSDRIKRFDTIVFFLNIW